VYTWYTSHGFDLLTVAPSLNDKSKTSLYYTLGDFFHRWSSTILPLLGRIFSSAFQEGTIRHNTTRILKLWINCGKKIACACAGDFFSLCHPVYPLFLPFFSRPNEISAVHDVSYSGYACVQSDTMSHDRLLRDTCDTTLESACS